jgi:hypothetical protein
MNIGFETKKAQSIAIIDGMDAPSLPSPRLAVEGRKTSPAGLLCNVSVTV